MLNKHLSAKLLWPKPVEGRVKALFTKYDIWLPVIPTPTPHPPPPALDMVCRRGSGCALHSVSHWGGLGPSLPTGAVALLQSWCQLPALRNPWATGAGRRRVSELWERGLGLMLKQPRSHQDPEDKSQGSGLEQGGGNPEVESPIVFCRNPPMQPIFLG